MKSETKVGIFVFIGLIFLFFLTMQVSSLKNFSKDGYYLYTYLDNVAGLDINSKVRVNGIEAGYVKDLTIDKNRVLVALFISKDIKIPKDSTVKLLQSSMLSGKYVSIRLGNSMKFAKDSDIIKSEPQMADFNDASNAMAIAADEFKEFLKELRDVLDDNSREDLKKTFANLEEISQELKAFVKLQKLDQMANNFNDMALNISDAGQNISKLTSQLSTTTYMVNKALPNILSELEGLMNNLNHVSFELKKKAPKLTEKLLKLERDVAAIIHENKKPLNESLTSASSFFNKGTDTFAKVDTLLESIDKIKLELDMRSEYMSSDKYFKGYLAFRYIPSDFKYYKFEIVGMDDYSKMDENNRLIEPKLHQSSKILISAQIAGRFDDLILRTGLFESTLGVAADYYFLNDRLKFSAEAFDINAQNDIRGTKPHTKLSLRYTFLSYFDLYAGYDNFLNKDGSNTFFGVGIHFIDNDLKTLISSLSLGSLLK